MNFNILYVPDMAQERNFYEKNYFKKDFAGILYLSLRRLLQAVETAVENAVQTNPPV